MASLQQKLDRVVARVLSRLQVEDRAQLAQLRTSEVVNRLRVELLTEDKLLVGQPSRPNCKSLGTKPHREWGRGGN